MSCETQSGVAGVPVIVEPVPVENHPVIALDEIRDMPVAVAIQDEMYKGPSMSLPLEFANERKLEAVSNLVS